MAGQNFGNKGPDYREIIYPDGNRFPNRIQDVVLLWVLYPSAPVVLPLLDTSAGQSRSTQMWRKPSFNRCLIVGTVPA